jgi:Flp pilus assembly protein CpaB
MQQRANGKKLMIIGVVLMVLIIGAGFMLTSRGGGSSNAGATSASASVVYATQNIPNGTVFKAGEPLDQFFHVRQAPLKDRPLGAYSSLKQISQLLATPGCGPVKAAGCEGQVTTSETIYQNLPVVDGMFTTLGQYRTAVGPSFAIPYGFVAIAIAFDLDNAVLGSIQAGDTIDLIASWKGPKGPGEPGYPPGVTQYALDDLRVIGVNAPPALPNSANGTASTTSTGTSSSTAGGGVVLLARYQQALEIQHLKDFGWTLSCVLRPAKATGILHFRTRPVTNRWFFANSSNPF